MQTKETQLRTLLVLVLGFGLLSLYFQRPLLLYIGLTLGILGIASDYLLTQITRLWEKIGHLLGQINGKILLTLVFYLILTPLAFLMRKLSKTHLPLTRTPGQSYFTDKPHTFQKKDLEELF